MARYIFFGQTKDQNGKILPSATVTVFLAGGVIPANVYAAVSGGAHISSLTSSATDATFAFYADTNDYAQSQRFKITVSKTNFQPVTLDYLVVYPWPSSSVGTYAATLTGDVTIPCNGQIQICNIDPGTAPRIANPAAGFINGAIIIINNTGSFDVTFDSTGLNASVGGGNKAIFTLLTTWH
jgi:hypothetical protein